jgi:hypothetical protein
MRYLILISVLLGCGSSSDPAPTTSKPIGIRDGDNNLYTSVTIGAQTWLTSDLKGRHYLDGAVVTGYSTYYYNFAALNDTKGLCPAGYQIPTAAQFETLLAHYGGDATALLDDFKPGVAGYFDATGTFQNNLPNHYFYWTATDLGGANAYNFMISTLDPSLKGTADKIQGFCVRCIKK